MRNLKQFLYTFFTLGKGEQKGIIILFLLILFVWIVRLLLPYIIAEENTDFTEYKKDIQNFRLSNKACDDSLKLREKQLKGSLTYEESMILLKPFDFDPNTIDKLSCLRIGFSEKQFNVIKNYRDKGGRFYKKEDFRKIYGISDAEFEIVEPYIKIDDAVLKKNKHETTFKEEIPHKKESSTKVSAQAEKKLAYKITELNSADTLRLTNNLHIKSSLAKRIIKYRELLGGFFEKEQLLEVYGFPHSYYNKIKSYILIDTLLIRKIFINEIEFKVLLKHPYFNYETTKLVFDAKSKSSIKQFSDFEGFMQKTAINDSLGSRIEHYLYFGRTK
jgi:DNA uptake protein ComE-like DNA-binding protein